MILGNHSFSIVIVDAVAKDQGLKIALGVLHGALPDATPEEIEAYDDECASCREPMAKTKRLSCKHLFHLTCLRSWYDLCCMLRSWTPPIMSREEFEARKADL
ncbi:hypothetical protein CsSME_00042108 [Camellia sinensis var. sinensis]